MTDTIAIIAPGEMGSGIGRKLRENGATVVTSLAGRSAASHMRAERAGLTPVESDDALVAAADVILSIVPPGEAVGLAQRLAPALTRASRKPIYVDCNAISPETADCVGAVLAGTGARYVDGGIIGPPPNPNIATKLYVSGDGAADVARLCRGIDVRVLDGPLGAASALKMSYAGITKGLTALGSVMILGASRGGAADALRAELAESQPQVLAMLARGVPGMFPKAYRWVAEMEEIAGFLAGDKPAQEIYGAMARLFDRLAVEAAADPSARQELAVLQAFCEQVQPPARKTA